MRLAEILPKLPDKAVKAAVERAYARAKEECTFLERHIDKTRLPEGVKVAGSSVYLEGKAADGSTAERRFDGHLSNVSRTDAQGDRVIVGYYGYGRIREYVEHRAADGTSTILQFHRNGFPSTYATLKGGMAVGLCVTWAEDGTVTDSRRYDTPTPLKITFGTPAPQTGGR